MGPTSKKFSFFTGLIVVFPFAASLLEPLESNWQTELNKMRSELDGFKKQIGVLNNTMNQRLAGGGPVAFTALLHQSITNMTPHTTIIFEDVLTNQGNGYNKNDGHFQAPVSGTYIFFLTLTSLPGHSASAYLMKDGKPIAQVLAHTTASNEYETSSTATTVTMATGERVWVQDQGQYSAVESLDGFHWSSFSGHLIH